MTRCDFLHPEFNRSMWITKLKLFLCCQQKGSGHFSLLTKLNPIQAMLLLLCSNQRKVAIVNITVRPLLCVGDSLIGYQAPNAQSYRYGCFEGQACRSPNHQKAKGMDDGCKDFSEDPSPPKSSERINKMVVCWLCHECLKIYKPTYVQ